MVSESTLNCVLPVRAGVMMTMANKFYRSQEVELQVEPVMVQVPRSLMINVLKLQLRVRSRKEAP